jgi:hypothetical protein
MPSKSKSKSRSRSRSPTYVSKIETKARELTKFLLETSLDDGGASFSFHGFENPVEIVKFLMTMKISKKKIVDFLQHRLLRDIVDDFYYTEEQQEIAEIMDKKEGWRGGQKVPSSWFVHYFFTSGWVQDYIKKNNWNMKEIAFST